MHDLIDDLSRATEGSEELDIAIARAIFGYKPDQPMWHVMPYTRDFAAARSLLPTGWCYQISDRGVPEAIIGPPHGPDMESIHAATVELAFCIACLEARMANA